MLTLRRSLKVTKGNLILSKFCMNDTITKTHLFLNMMFDLKGHIRLHEAFLCLKIRFFLFFLILSKLHMNVNIMNTQILQKLSMTSKVIQGLLRPFQLNSF